MIIIEVAGAQVQRRKGSLSISSVLSRRNTATFDVVDVAGALVFSKGQSVNIWKTYFPPFLTLEFSGVVDLPRAVRADGITVHTLSCIGWRYLAEKRRVAKSYTATDVDDIVTDIVTDYLIPEGVTILSIAGTGLNIAEAVFNYAKASDCLDALAERVGYMWDINQDKEFYFGPRTVRPAPFGIGYADIIRDTNSFASESPKYLNRQYLRGGVDVTSLQTQNFTGDGETASFALAYPVHAEPTITVDAAAKTVGLKGVDTGKDWYWSMSDPVLQAEGIPLAGEAIVIQYYGEYPMMVVVEDATEIADRAAVEGNTGIVEDVATIPSARTVDALTDAGLARLAKYGLIGRQFRFNTWRFGLAPGDLVPITYAQHGLTGEQFLVESVEMTELAPDTYAYAVSAVEGPEIGDWTELFKSLADIKSDLMDRLDVGTAAGDILIVLASVPETIQLTEAVVEDVFACPVPAAGLFPSGGLYPC